MNFNIGDKVRIVWNNVVGEVIDTEIGPHNGRTYYIVESDTAGPIDDPRAYPFEYPLFDCLAEEIEHI